MFLLKIWKPQYKHISQLPQSTSKHLNIMTPERTPIKSQRFLSDMAEAEEFLPKSAAVSQNQVEIQLCVSNPSYDVGTLTMELLPDGRLTYSSLILDELEFVQSKIHPKHTLFGPPVLQLGKRRPNRPQCSYHFLSGKQHGRSCLIRG